VIENEPVNGSSRRPATKQGKTLPHNLDAEASVLGGIILKPEVLPSLSTLEIDDFYHLPHKIVFEAVRNLEAAKVPIDVTTLDAEVARHGKSEATGGIAFLGELAMRVPTVDNIVAYTKIIRDLAMMRRLALRAAKVLERVSDWEYEADEFLGETLRDFQDIERGYREAGDRVPIITVGAALEQLDRLAKTPIYKTPFTEVNKAIGFGGLLGGQVYTIVSGTGAGKTSFVSTVGEFHAENQGDTLIATWEMIPGYFVARMAAKHLKVHSNQILRGERRWGEVQSAVPRRLEFLERPSLSTLKRAIEQVVRAGRPPPLVIVDYIQALAEDLSPSMPRLDPKQLNSFVSRELVKISKETGAPMLIVSATARMTAAKLVVDVRKQSPRDLVGAAKETSQIEYDGAGLIVLSLSEEEDLDGQIATMTIAKARFGEACHIDARYDGRRGAWIEIGRVQKAVKAGGSGDANISVIRDAVLGALRKHGPAGSKSTLAKWTNKAKAASLSEIGAMLDDGTLEFRGSKIVIAGMQPVTTEKVHPALVQTVMAELAGGSGTGSEPLDRPSSEPKTGGAS